MLRFLGAQVEQAVLRGMVSMGDDHDQADPTQREAFRTQLQFGQVHRRTSRHDSNFGERREGRSQGKYGRGY